MWWPGHENEELRESRSTQTGMSLFGPIASAGRRTMVTLSASLSTCTYMISACTTHPRAEPWMDQHWQMMGSRNGKIRTNESLLRLEQLSIGKSSGATVCACFTGTARMRV